MDDKSAAAMADRVTKAEATLAQAEKDRDAALADLKTANATADANAQDRDAARSELEKADQELACAREKLSQIGDQLATITEQEAAGKPRSLVAPKTPKSTDPDDIAEARTALRAKIEDADDVEIMFSDGRKQIMELGVRKIAGDAWKDSSIGLLLDQPVELYGVGIGGGTLTIAGYALILDGEVAAYTPRDELQIQPGAHVKLENDIYF
jgi:hypothetical protein